MTVRAPALLADRSGMASYIDSYEMAFLDHKEHGGISRLRGSEYYSRFAHIERDYVANSNLHSQLKSALTGARF